MFIYCIQFPRILLYNDRIFILTQREVSHALLWHTYTLPVFAGRGLIRRHNPCFAQRKQNYAVRALRICMGGRNWSLKT